MKLYVANFTRQVQDFTYRVMGQNGIRSQPIRIGGQIQVSGDLSLPEIEGIIQQHLKYGMVPVETIDRTKPFIGLCYSVDKKIKAETIARGMEHNQLVLHERGVRTRREAAVAANNLIDEHVQEVMKDANLREFEMTIDEEDRKDNPDPPLSEGIIVSKDAPNASPKPTTARPRRERARRAA